MRHLVSFADMNDGAPLAHWSPVLGASLSTAVIRSHHRLADLGVFDDEHLVQILDHHPRAKLQAYAPNTPGVSAWPAVDLGRADGVALLDAVRTKGLWLNVIGLESWDERSRELVIRLFGEISEVLPDLLPETVGATLLISSPGATVPYHFDPDPNVLWQLRGRKRIYIYPARNDAFATRDAREDLVGGYLREYIHYDPTFDEAALTEEIGPGDVLAWAHNSPHRVLALEGMNVTLSTDFQTKRTRRWRHVWGANRFLGRRLHLPARSTAERGLASMVKIGAFGAARKLGLARPGTPPVITAELRLDESGQIEPLATPVQAEFV
jgi:hypothetical protein